MKLYILQGFLQETNELYNYEVFYREPTVKDIFNALTGENYYLLSEERIEESLGYMNLTLSNIEIDLLQTNSVTTDSHIYYLSIIELDNKKTLNNMNEDLHVLTYTDTTEGSFIDEILINEITINKIDNYIINDIVDYYQKDYFKNSSEAISYLLDGKDVPILDYQGKFQWHTINTKDIR